MLRCTKPTFPAHWERGGRESGAEPPIRSFPFFYLSESRGRPGVKKKKKGKSKIGVRASLFDVFWKRSVKERRRRGKEFRRQSMRAFCHLLGSEHTKREKRDKEKKKEGKGKRVGGGRDLNITDRRRLETEREKRQGRRKKGKGGEGGK